MYLERSAPAAAYRDGSDASPRTVGTQTMKPPYTDYRDTPVWAAVASVLADLQASGEVTVATAPEYVIGYFCRELVAKKIVAGDALDAGPTP